MSSFGTPALITAEVKASCSSASCAGVNECGSCPRETVKTTLSLPSAAEVAAAEADVAVAADVGALVAGAVDAVAVDVAGVADDDDGDDNDDDDVVSVLAAATADDVAVVNTDALREAVVAGVETLVLTIVGEGVDVVLVGNAVVLVNVNSDVGIFVVSCLRAVVSTLK